MQEFLQWLCESEDDDDSLKLLLGFVALSAVAGAITIWLVFLL